MGACAIAYVRSDPMIIFVFTDIEGSTRLWEKHRHKMMTALQQHDAILKATIAEFGGYIVEHTGDGVFAVFEGGQPLEAILAIQSQFAGADWGEIGELRIRIGLDGRRPDKHGIDYFPRGNGYFGPAVNQAMRIMSVGWGGQILLSAEALALCQLPAGAIAQDLGLHSLKNIVRPQHIFSLTRPGLPYQQFPPLHTEQPQTSNLPTPPTPFINRDQERSTISQLLTRSDCQLITLVGHGGIGKSRLAMQIAYQNMATFAHGVYFVPLAPIPSTDFILPAIADTLQLSFYNREDPKPQLLHYLHGKNLLLVMDNFEHVTDGAALVSEMINQSPMVKILVTSRIKLNLREEWAFEVSGMSVPEELMVDPGRDLATYPSVQLFLQTAHHIDPTFKLRPEDEPYLRRICQLLHGMPLAIELAASWLKMLTCQEIAQEIESNLDFLVTPMQDVPQRHQSLRAVFDHSWDLLTPQERLGIARLSIFRGGFQREAAGQIGAVGLPMLARLMDKSLIRKGALPGRYEIHELLRQYAAEKLSHFPNEPTRTGQAHCHYYLQFVNHQTPRLKGAQQKEALVDIRQEIENIRTAWQWAVEQADEQAINLAFEPLIQFQVMNSRFQDIALLFKNSGLSQRPLSPKLVAIFQLGRGIAHFYLGQYEQGLEQLQAGLQSLRGTDDLLRQCILLYYLGGTYMARGHYAMAQTALQESLPLARSQNDPFLIFLVLLSLGSVNRMMGNYELSEQIHQECLTIGRQLNNSWCLANAYYMLGLVFFAQAEYKESRPLLQESLTLYEEIGDLRSQAFTLNRLGFIASELGNLSQAEQLYHEAIQLASYIADRWGMVLSAMYLAQINLQQGDIVPAGNYLQQGLQLSIELSAAPLTLQLLLPTADFFNKLGDQQKSIQLLTFVQNHPAVEKTTFGQAQALLEKLIPAGPPPTLETLAPPSLPNLVTKLLTDWPTMDKLSLVVS